MGDVLNYSLFHNTLHDRIKTLETKVPKHSYMRGEKGRYVQVHFLARKFKAYF